MGLGTAAGIHFDLHQGVRGAHACTPHVGVGDGMSTPASCAMQAIGDAEPSAIISRTLTICLLIVLYFMPMRVWLSFFTVVCELSSVCERSSLAVEFSLSGLSLLAGVPFAARGDRSLP